MVPAKRRDKIMKIIQEKGEVKTSNLSTLLQASNMTINRDLKFLEKNSLITKIYGGAIFPKSKLYDLEYDKRVTTHLKNKEIIAEKAVKLIDNGDSIILDDSTTCIVMARYLAKCNFSELTVITNSNYVMNELKYSNNITIISTGGEFIPKDGSMIGMYTENFISKLRAKKFFFSVAGISIEEGLTDQNITSIQVKNKFLGIVDKIYLLIDSNKFNNILTHKVCDLSLVDVIVSDKEIDPNFIKTLKTLNKIIEVI